jgi:hypothetical protein
MRFWGRAACEAIPRSARVLDAQEIQGNGCAQKEDQANADPVEKKESVRWQDNLKQAMAPLNDPVHPHGDREIDADIERRENLKCF